MLLPKKEEEKKTKNGNGLSILEHPKKRTHQEFIQSNGDWISEETSLLNINYARFSWIIHALASNERHQAEDPAPLGGISNTN